MRVVLACPELIMESIVNYTVYMTASNPRSVSLTDEQDELVGRLVESGRYASASEVIGAGLRLVQREDEGRLLEKWLHEGLSAEEEARLRPGVLQRARQSLQAKVRQGMEEARRGEVVDGAECLARLKRRLEEVAAAETEHSGRQTQG